MLDHQSRLIFNPIMPALCQHRLIYLLCSTYCVYPYYSLKNRTHGSSAGNFSHTQASTELPSLKNHAHGSNAGNFPINKQLITKIRLECRKFSHIKASTELASLKNHTHGLSAGNFPQNK